MTNAEAIEYIKKNCYGEWCEDDWREAMDMAIKALSSAKSERKKGKWVQDDIASNVFRCSECGCDAPVDPTAGCEIKSNYCQWCGIDMRMEDEE